MMSNAPIRLRAFGLAAVLCLGSILPAPAADLAGDALRLINQARREAGCPSLRVNPALQRAAQVQAQGMATQNYFSHRDRSGQSYTQRAKAQGYDYHFIGENIAAGQSSAALVVQNWLASPSHRRNILDCRFTETGIALSYQADDQPMRGLKKPLHYYWAQVFGTPWQ